jgi:Fe-S-cluster containining protein
VRTILKPTDRLPLTCTRAGTCCHGKAVWLNPWELAQLARARQLSPRALRDSFLEAGIRLKFDGPLGWKGLAACSQYDPASGCLVHAGRPLACRLYPLGRERQRDRTRYIYQGKKLPCLEGCPGVVDLAKLTVEEYLIDQAVAAGEVAQDAYLELVQELAEGAFVLLLETGLAASGDRETLPRWRALGRMSPADRAASIPEAWRDRLTVPPIPFRADDPAGFVAAHQRLLQQEAQAAFGALPDAASMRDACCLMLAMALHLGQSVGSDPAALVQHWIDTARRNGAKESPNG